MEGEQIETLVKDFIREAYQKNIIVQYVAFHSQCRKFYIANFLNANRTDIPYSIFIRYLKDEGYVHFRMGTITFNRKDVDEFTKDLRSRNVPQNVGRSNVEQTNICEICLTKPSDANHAKSDIHLTNAKYRTSSNLFKKNPDFQLKLITTEFDENNPENAYSIKALHLELKNAGRTTYSFKNIVLIQQAGLTNSPLTKHKLKPEECLNLTLKGSLENDSTIILIGILVSAKDGIQYYLEDIPIDIVKDVDHRSVAIIRGVRPEDEIAPVGMPLQLKSYRIHRYFLYRLENFKRIQPQFVQRLNFETEDLFAQWAQKLKIPTILTQANYDKMLRQILDIEEYQMIVDIRHYDTVATLRYHRTTKIRNQTVDLYKLKVPGLAESKPSLIKHDSVFARLKEKYQDRHKYEGVVHQVHEAEVDLAFHHTFNSVKVKSANNQEFRIEFGFNRRPMRVEKQAVELVKIHKIAEYFFPKSIGQIQECSSVNFFNRSLNDEQKRAVQNILIKKPLPYLIFGPPGTGKTVTVVEAILQIWHSQKNARVLVCTPSNDAADVVTNRLFDVIKNSVDICRFIGFLRSSSTKKYYESQIDKILKYRIVISTIINAARLVNGGVSAGHFDYVFIDESGYATETESLIPVAGMLCNAEEPGKIFGQVILAGDPRQLGPRIHSTFAKFCGFGKSMLERLLDTCEVYKRRENTPSLYDPRCVTKLRVNYRSHETILKIPNELFYNGDLLAANNDFCRLFTNWEGLEKKNFPVIFHHIEGEDKREDISPSFFNDKEIQTVMTYTTELMRDTRGKGKLITEADLGILTPYRRQMEKLQDLCSKNNWKNLKIGNVQQFQGKETTVLIISTVRSKNFEKFQEIDQLYELGLMFNPKRFNVAMTRPKALLIVVGNGEILSADYNWRTFIQYCMDNNSIKGSVFNLAKVKLPTKKI